MIFSSHILHLAAPDLAYSRKYFEYYPSNVVRLSTCSEVSKERPVNHLTSSSSLTSLLAFLPSWSRACQGTFLNLLGDFLLILPPRVNTTTISDGQFKEWVSLTSESQNVQFLQLPWDGSWRRNNSSGTNLPASHQRMETERNHYLIIIVREHEQQIKPESWQQSSSLPSECQPCIPYI